MSNVPRPVADLTRLLATNIASAAFVDAGLVNGTTYYYVVSALNPAGESANSSQAYAMPGTLNRIIWVASSSTTGSDDPDNALDGNLSTRWSTGGFAGYRPVVPGGYGFGQCIQQNRFECR